MLLSSGAYGPAFADEPAPARLGFDQWPAGGLAEVVTGERRLRLAVSTPDPRADGSRRRFNVRSAGSFPLWGWKPGRCQDLWSATGEFTLRAEAPPGEYLLAIVVGEYDEGESAFDLRLGEKEAQLLRAPMPEGTAEGRPFAVYRVLSIDKPVTVTLRKRPEGEGKKPQGAALLGVELTPLAEARARGGAWVREAKRVFEEPFYYDPVERVGARMLQVIDLSERVQRVAEVGSDEAKLAQRLAFKARYWLTLESRWGKHSDAEMLRVTLDLAAAQGEHPEVKRYLSSWALGYPNSDGGMLPLPLLLSLRYRGAGERWEMPAEAKVNAAHTPAWAARLIEVQAKLGQLSHYWCAQRQREDGHLGGRLDDDVEVMRNLRLPALARGDVEAIRGYRRIAEAMYASGQIRDGYPAQFRDVEHSSEYLTDALCPTILHAYPDDAVLKRLEQSARCVPRWVTRNDNGRWFFKSVYFDAHGFATDPDKTTDLPRGREDTLTDGFDCFYNGQAVGPAVWWLWHNDDPQVREALTRWLRSWHEVAQKPWNNRPAGVYPSVIKFKGEEQACLGGKDFLKPQTGFDYYDEWRGNIPWMVLALAMYQVTDDAQFLGMIEDSLRWVRDNEKDRRKLGKVYSEVREQCSWVFPAWRAETGRDTYDKFFADSMDMVAAGDVATWGKAIEAQRWLVEELSKGVLDHLAVNYAMFTSEVVFTDRVYVRGIDLLEPVLYGLPNGRGFGLPMFRATAEAPPKVAWSCLVTKKDRLAVLAANADDKPQEMTLRPVHLPTGPYVMKVYDANELTKPLEEAPLRVERRLQPIKVMLPITSERLIVLERRSN
jgi:hypothetical protein